MEVRVPAVAWELIAPKSECPGAQNLKFQQPRTFLQIRKILRVILQNSLLLQKPAPAIDSLEPGFCFVTFFFCLPPRVPHLRPPRRRRPGHTPPAELLLFFFFFSLFVPCSLHLSGSPKLPHATRSFPPLSFSSLLLSFSYLLLPLFFLSTTPAPVGHLHAPDRRIRAACGSLGQRLHTRSSRASSTPRSGASKAPDPPKQPRLHVELLHSPAAASPAGSLPRCLLCAPRRRSASPPPSCSPAAPAAGAAPKSRSDPPGRTTTATPTSRAAGGKLCSATAVLVPSPCHLAGCAISCTVPPPRHRLLHAQIRCFFPQILFIFSPPPLHSTAPPLLCHGRPRATRAAGPRLSAPPCATSTDPSHLAPNSRRAVCLLPRRAPSSPRSCGHLPPRLLLRPRPLRRQLPLFGTVFVAGVLHQAYIQLATISSLILSPAPKLNSCDGCIDLN